MTQSIKDIYDAILAAAKRDELIVIDDGIDDRNLAMLCAVSMDSLEITPLAMIYGDESKQSESAPFTADDCKFPLAMESNAPQFSCLKNESHHRVATDTITQHQPHPVESSGEDSKRSIR